jgi:hypothetical protein
MVHLPALPFPASPDAAARLRRLAIALALALTAALLAWQLPAVRRHLDPEGHSRARAEALVGPAMAWAAAELGLPVPEAPEIRFADRTRMARLRFGAEFSAEQAEHVLALYDTDRQIMYLPEGWTGDDPASMSILVHEVVHHVQEAASVDFPCLAAREKDAYALQARWLEERGEDLFARFEINDLALHFLTHCSEGSSY